MLHQVFPGNDRNRPRDADGLSLRSEAFEVAARAGEHYHCNIIECEIEGLG